MSTVLGGVALAVVAAGILAAAGVAVRAGLRQGVPVLLDFLLAAGLLRLSVATGWQELVGIALIVAVRHLLTFGLSASRPSPSTRRSEPAGAGPAPAPRGSR